MHSAGVGGYLVKYFMSVYAVCADGHGIGVQKGKIRVDGGNCRQFSRSDKSKIAGIKKQQQPSIVILAEAYGCLPAIKISRGRKIGSRLFKGETWTGSAGRRALTRCHNTALLSKKIICIFYVIAWAKVRRKRA